MSDLRNAALIGVLLVHTCLFSSLMAYSGGSGTPDDPYQIATADDLIALGQTYEDYARCFVLTNDIDLNPYINGRAPFTEAIIAPCYSHYDNGDEVFYCSPRHMAFAGAFNGNGHVIRNLHLVGAHSLGLFGIINKQAIIQNLGLVDSIINGEGDGLGALVVYNESGRIENCFSTGFVLSAEGSVAGGLIGWNNGGQVIDCHSLCEVQAEHRTGGLVGQINSGCLLHCYANGPVEGMTAVGGLAGLLEEDGTILNCHSSSTVDGQYSVGGLVGDVSLGMLVECYSTGTVQGNQSVGGLAGGHNYYRRSERLGRGDLIGCYSTSAVTGNQWVGGLIGNNLAGVIVGSHYQGDVRGGLCTGGLAGANVSGAIRQCYSIGSVTGTTCIGGLVGSNGDSDWDYKDEPTIPGLVDNSYSQSTVDGNDVVGGLIGHNSRYSVVSQCYSTETTQGETFIGNLIGANASGFRVQQCFRHNQANTFQPSTSGTGLTFNQMQDSQAFLDSDWDFENETANGLREIWRMPTSGGPPELIPYPIDPVTLIGQGTREAPYLIASAEQLLAMRHNPRAHYQLEQDIDLSNHVYSTALIPWFGGPLNGQSHEIKSLQIQGSGSLGLFSTLAPSAFVRNVRLSGVKISTSEAYTVYVKKAGGGRSRAVSAQEDEDTIEVTIQTNYSTNAGSLAGRNEGQIVSCCAEGAILGLANVGGFVGENRGRIISCYSEGSASAEGETAGGLIAVNAGFISNSYSSQSVDANALAGGLVGDNTRGSIHHCYSAGLARTNEAGEGLVGINHRYEYGGLLNPVPWVVMSPTDYYLGQITNCFWIKHDSYSYSWNWPLSGRIVSENGQELEDHELQDTSVLLDAGWDFASETANGTADFWLVDEAGGYPVLRAFQGTDAMSVFEGQGSHDDPFVIGSPNDLGRLWRDPHAHYQLDADIDCQGISWSTAPVPWFAGTFDGNDHTVDNLKIDGAGYLGFFGILDSQATVSHLHLRHADVNGVMSVPELSDESIHKWIVGDKHTGALAGYNEGRISDCSAIGSISGTSRVGGLLGSNEGTLIRSFSTTAVQGSAAVGGLAGGNYARIEQCYSQGMVHGNEIVGGLVGMNFDGWIFDSYSRARPHGDSVLGGLAGHHIDGIIGRCYSTTSNYGLTSDHAYNNGSIEDCPRNESERLDFWYLKNGLGWNFGQQYNGGGGGRSYGNETSSGTSVIWVMDQGSPPRLAWERVNPSIRYSGGSGLPHDPYEIATFEDLIVLSNRENDWDKHFALIADIDLSGITWRESLIAPAITSSPYSWDHSIPSTKPFTGSFNGQGHVIHYLTIKGHGGLGLFGIVGTNVIITNLGLTNVTLSGTGSNFGALAGTVYGATITQCFSSGQIEGSEYVGGLIGDFREGNLENCYSTVALTGKSLHIGHLAGRTGGDSTNCYGAGTITLTNPNPPGGGRMKQSANALMADQLWTGDNTFEPTNKAEGFTLSQMLDMNTYLAAGWDFVGEASNGLSDIWQMPQEEGLPVLSIFQEGHDFLPAGQGSQADPYVITTAAELGTIWKRPFSHYSLGSDIDLTDVKWRTAPTSYFGGTFNGQGYAITNMTIEGDKNLALFGVLLPGSSVRRLGITDVKIFGELTCYIGGTSGGRSIGSTQECYSIMTGGVVCGALAGENYGSIHDCFATGLISGTDDIGGLVGQHQGFLTNSYAAVAVDGRTISEVYGIAGPNNAKAVNCFWDADISGASERGAGTGLTTTNMQYRYTFINAGWDFVGENANGTDYIWIMPIEGGYPILWNESLPEEVPEVIPPPIVIPR